MEGKSIVISAPSGAGKTSIVNFILAKINSIEFSISACNRKQRPDEVNGKNYHFLSNSDFKEKIDKGLFLEWEEVYPDQFYGTPFSSVTTIWVLYSKLLSSSVPLFNNLFFNSSNEGGVIKIEIQLF